MSQFKEITVNGLWKQNPGVVQLLGLCPTLAVTTTVVNGVSLGLATALVMAASNGAVSPVRRFVPNEIRLPVFILVIAALVTVIDSGIGIPQESRELIFEEFRQVSEGLERVFEGSGLGLSITKRFVELMNGNISVETQ